VTVQINLTNGALWGGWAGVLQTRILLWPLNTWLVPNIRYAGGFQGRQGCTWWTQAPAEKLP